MYTQPGMNIRPPAVAGQFYPADPARLEALVQASFDEARKRPAHPVKAMIVPHAGLIYSGPVAASAYRMLRPQADRIRRVVLLGPSHRVGFRGLAASSADAYETPFGIIPLDKSAIARIQALPQVHLLDEAHRYEHSLEVQLPFLQAVLDDFGLVPLVVGDATPGEVAEVLEQLWGGDETLIVISSDLSHYHPYDEARMIDSATSQAILELDPSRIGYDNACGRNPVNGLLELARRHGLKPELVDLRNSGDTAGDKSQVVGYGAYVFSDPGQEQPS
jgi:AmmeMemoRadiSam system protein B